MAIRRKVRHYWPFTHVTKRAWRRSAHHWEEQYQQERERSDTRRRLLMDLVGAVISSGAAEAVVSNELGNAIQAAQEEIAKE